MWSLVGYGSGSGSPRTTLPDLLYAPYARQGLAQNRTRTFLDLFGTVHTTSQLVWTEKGREFIHKLLLN